MDTTKWFLVYHAKRPTFDLVKHIEFNLKEFDLVAIVESETLGDVFRITNSIEDFWGRNPEVKCAKTWCRSTSVGDVVVDAAGNRFRCEMIGWKQF